MPLQCENCQKTVGSISEVTGCRCCSQPPPPPSPSARPRYDASAPVVGLDMETLKALEDGKILPRPKPATIGDLLRAQHGDGTDDAPLFV